MKSVKLSPHIIFYRYGDKYLDFMTLEEYLRDHRINDAPISVIRTKTLNKTLNYFRNKIEKKFH